MMMRITRPMFHSRDPLVHGQHSTKISVVSLVLFILFIRRRHHHRFHRHHLPPRHHHHLPQCRPR